MKWGVPYYYTFQKSNIVTIIGIKRILCAFDFQTSSYSDLSRSEKQSTGDAKIEIRTAEKIREATIMMLSDKVRKTLTSDNGKEFAHHELVAEALGDSYFTHPYSSWD